jgi:transposase
MDSKQKQRAVIEFLMKEGCRLSNIHRRLQNVYRDDTTDRSNVHRWMKFKERETGIEDKPRSGRPSTATTDTNCQRTDELICTERRVTLCELACITMLWRSGYNSAYLNSFKKNSRVGFNDGTNASLLMETMFSSTFLWRKSYSTNMCNLNDYSVNKKCMPTFALLSVLPSCMNK